MSLRTVLLLLFKVKFFLYYGFAGVEKVINFATNKEPSQ